MMHKYILYIFMRDLLLLFIFEKIFSYITIVYSPY